MANPSPMDRAMACLSIVGIDPADDDASNEVRLHLPGKPDDYVVVGDTGPYYLDEAVVLARSAEGIIAAVVEAAVAAERVRYATLVAAARAYQETVPAYAEAARERALADHAPAWDHRHDAAYERLTAASERLVAASEALDAALANLGAKP